MASLPDQDINTGLYIGTTTPFDVAQLYEVDVDSPQFIELLVRLYQTVNEVALSLNLKDSAYYVQEEFVNGQLYFSPTTMTINEPDKLRGVFRKVINTGALAAGVTNTNHGLTPATTWKFTRIYGAASNTGTTTYVPLPFSGVGVGNILVLVNATQVVINNGSGMTFTDSYVVLEYVKS